MRNRELNNLRIQNSKLAHTEILQSTRTIIYNNNQANAKHIKKAKKKNHLKIAKNNEKLIQDKRLSTQRSTKTRKVSCQISSKCKNELKEEQKLIEIKKIGLKKLSNMELRHMQKTCSTMKVQEKEFEKLQNALRNPSMMCEKYKEKIKDLKAQIYYNTNGAKVTQT